MRPPRPLQPWPAAVAEAVQRQETTERRDVVLDVGGGNQAYAATIAGDGAYFVIRSVDDFATHLRSVDYPIGTLYVLGHSGQGVLWLGGRELEMRDLAEAVRGTIASENAPSRVAFMGCRAGRDPADLDAVRSALGAGSAEGASCYAVRQEIRMSLTGVDPARGISAYSEQEVADIAEDLRGGIQGLPSHLRRSIIDDSVEAWFRAGGIFVAVWSSPTHSAEFDRLSCRPLPEMSVDIEQVETAEVDPYNIMIDCRIIRVEGEE